MKLNSAYKTRFYERNSAYKKENLQVLMQSKRGWVLRHTTYYQGCPSQVICRHCIQFFSKCTAFLEDENISRISLVRKLWSSMADLREGSAPLTLTKRRRNYGRKKSWHGKQNKTAPAPLIKFWIFYWSCTCGGCFCEGRMGFWIVIVLRGPRSLFFM